MIFDVKADELTLTTYEKAEIKFYQCGNNAFVARDSILGLLEYLGSLKLPFNVFPTIDEFEISDTYKHYTTDGVELIEGDDAAERFDENIYKVDEIIEGLERILDSSLFEGDEDKPEIWKDAARHYKEACKVRDKLRDVEDYFRGLRKLKAK